MFKYFVNITICIIVSLLISSCDDIFEFSPYQANVSEEYENQNAKSIGELYLKNGSQSVDSFSFVTIADSHNEFKDLEKAVDKINSLNNIDFVVHLGDFADKGLLEEYEIYSDIINELNPPIITCIGNHDYLSNGSKIYEQMFGDYNFVLDYKGVKFVFFDATTFESNKHPDMDWFESQITKDSLPKFILSHIPPFDNQYSEYNAYRYKHLVETELVIASVHGHHHNYYYGSPLGTELQFLIPGSIGKKMMSKVTVYSNHSYSFELIIF